MLDLKNKTILITGGTGSWGNELTKQILDFGPKEIRIYSRGEIRQWEMKKRFNNNPKLKFIIGDVRDQARLQIALHGVNFVFHMAALKHVPVCEENPNETVKTNIIGMQNIINATISNEVERLVFVSTDKAVDPLNLYGITKSCAERLMIAANNAPTRTRFICVRAGNVIGTNGSVVPLFREQILTKGAITLTDERMTRFFITLKDAVKLLFKSIDRSFGGEVFVMKMPSAKITDLAEVMSKALSDKPVKIEKIGIRPGEKIHEVLVSRYEAGRVIEDGNYFIILPLISIPGLKERYKNRKLSDIEEYSSDHARRLNKEEIRDMLDAEGWLDRDRKQDTYIDVKKDPNLPKGIYHV